MKTKILADFQICSSVPLSISIFPEDTLKDFNHNLLFVKETRNFSKI